MTPLGRVREARAALAAITVVRSVLWASAAGLTGDALVGLLVGRSDLARAALLCASAGVAGVMIWRGRAAWSVERTFCRKRNSVIRERSLTKLGAALT